MSLTTLLVIFAMLLANALFAAYELALASVRINRLKALAEQRRRGAATALKMKNRMEGSLAVVQLGITLVGAIAAAAGGASAEEDLGPWLAARLAVPEYWADLLALAMIVIPLAGITIIAGELIPKVLAIKNAEFVCTLLSPAMWVFNLLVYPAVWLLEGVTKAFVVLVERAFPSQQGDDHQTGLHELRAQVNVLRASQAIGMQEERIIIQASRLSSMKVGDIMMPEDDIVMVLADAPLSENLVIAHMDLHTRFPVTARRGDPQAIIGYVTFKDMVLLAKTHPGNPILREIVRPLISLAAELRLSEALRRMTAEHQHLALVRSDGGRVAGMITQEDIFEELVGDIQDEFDRLPKHISPAGQQLVVGGGVTLAHLRTTLQRPNLSAAMPPTTTLNDWLNHGREEPLKGGDMIVVDGVWAQIRKVRRRRITEALLDPLGDPFGKKPSESGNRALVSPDAPSAMAGRNAAAGDVARGPGPADAP